MGVILESRDEEVRPLHLRGHFHPTTSQHLAGGTEITTQTEGSWTRAPEEFGLRPWCLEAEQKGISHTERRCCPPEKGVCGLGTEEMQESWRAGPRSPMRRRHTELHGMKIQVGISSV